MHHINSFDEITERNEFFFRVPGLQCCLKDQRDEPICHLLLNVCFFWAFWMPVVQCSNSHVVGSLYFVFLMVFFYERFVLALHFASHRKIFQMNILNMVPQYFMAPFFGIPPGFYSAHHLIMHHTEENKFPADLSSTEVYQRDNFIHFMIYYCSFLSSSFVRLPLYILRQKRHAMFLQLVLCLIFYVRILASVYRYSVVLATWFLIAPLVLGSFFLMLGNWSQHVFINEKNPDCAYGIAFDIINSPSNQKTFNDGYHLQHHLNSRKHWTELPRAFQENIEKMKQSKGLVFSNTSFVEIGINVFLQRYDKLIMCYVSLQENPQSAKEIESLLRQRLRPIHRWRDGKHI